jgi:hypothetical protein
VAQSSGVVGSGAISTFAEKRTAAANCRFS